MRRINADAVLSRRHTLDWMRYAWRTASSPFVVGKHTTEICQALDDAVEEYRAGGSVFLCIQVPPRHGKSDIVSRYFPPRFLGMFPDAEVMVASYASDMSTGLSKDARDILTSEEFRETWPGVVLDPDSSAVKDWQIKGRKGRTVWTGVGGPATGKGYDYGVVDDFFKNREEAESPTIRAKVWDWFTQVFLTRRGPRSITVVMATPWNTDDLFGRIRERMQSDPDFPKFRFITFPAVDDSGAWLFPERYSDAWYREQRASAGAYGWQSLFMCAPVARGGNLICTDKIKYVDSADLFPKGLRWVRFWDLASTKQETAKDDPDYTVGALLAVEHVRGVEINVKKLYIKDVVRGRWNAPDRDRIIRQTAEMDGPSVRIIVEAVGGYKDTFTTLQEALRGSRSVSAVQPNKDKVLRSESVLPVFEAGNVTLLRAEWNAPLVSELSAFPNGGHDDQVDAITGGFLAEDVSSKFADLPSYTREGAR